MGIVIFVAAILIVVMIHEAGHFLVAKAFDFKATKFFLGFGPTLWSFQRGETEYGVKALPLGGFVKIVGMNPYEEVPPEDEPRSYPNKPAWQRALVLVAGSATHWVVAFLILLLAVMFVGLPARGVTNEISQVTTSIGDSRETPAAAARLRPGDRIVAVGGEETTRWRDIQRYIRAQGGKEATFTIERDGDTLEVTTELGEAVFGPEGPVAYAPAGESVTEELGRPLKDDEEIAGFLGVMPEPRYEKEGLVGATGESARITWQITKNSVVGIGDVFGMVFGGDLFDALSGSGPRDIEEGPVGLVGAGSIAQETVARGLYLELMGFIASFTIFVGIMNLLPLPPLDGGHLAVVGYEAVTGRKVDVRKLIPVAAAVISFFVLLFLAVLYLDLARPVTAPF